MHNKHAQCMPLNRVFKRANQNTLIGNCFVQVQDEQQLPLTLRQKKIEIGKVQNKKM